MTIQTAATRSHRRFQYVLLASLIVCGVVIVFGLCDAVGEFLLTQAAL